MQCTSYIPVYHARDVNVGSSGFSWHLLTSNANYGEENGCNISLPLYNMGQYLSHDKGVLRQIIQNHDATFRHQVQELHRLYKKQREMMDEMRIRKFFSQNLLSQTSDSIRSLSHARSDISQAISHATSWLLGDHSHGKLSELTASTVQQPPKFIASNYFREHPTPHTGPSVRKNSCNENRILGIELPAGAYRGDEENQFTERNVSEAPELTHSTREKLPNIHPATGSEIGSFKTRDLSSFNLSNGKGCCFIGLNEPIQIEALPSSSKCPMETYSCRMETMHNNPCISDSLVPKDGSSDCIKSSVAIDLNYTPDSCFSGTEINLEPIRTIKMEATEILDKCVEDHPFVDTKINKKLLKTETDIDLNTDVVPNEPSPSSSTVQTKSGGDRDLKGPLSPDNEECSPPRGKSEENIQLERGKKEPSMELDIIAARSLVTISSCGAYDCLSWFAEIVFATGDDLENKITKLKNDAVYNNQGEVLSVSDFGAIELNSSEENALHIFSRVKKEKEAVSPSVRSQKGHARGTRMRRKDPRTEVLSQNVGEIEGFLGKALSRKRTGKKGGAKPGKSSKVSSDRVRKPMSSILKRPATLSKHGVLRGWGKIKKREGGLRRKASKFLVISG